MLENLNSLRKGLLALAGFSLESGLDKAHKQLLGVEWTRLEFWVVLDSNEEGVVLYFDDFDKVDVLSEEFS